MCACVCLSVCVRVRILQRKLLADSSMHLEQVKPFQRLRIFYQMQYYLIYETIHVLLKKHEFTRSNNNGCTISIYIFFPYSVTIFFKSNLCELKWVILHYYNYLLNLFLQHCHKWNLELSLCRPKFYFVSVRIALFDKILS